MCFRCRMGWYGKSSRPSRLPCLPWSRAETVRTSTRRNVYFLCDTLWNARSDFCQQCHRGRHNEIRFSIRHIVVLQTTFYAHGSRFHLPTNVGRNLCRRARDDFYHPGVSWVETPGENDDGFPNSESSKSLVTRYAYNTFQCGHHKLAS